MFANIDKSKFEIYSYSSFKKEGKERNKIIENSEEFFDLDNQPDDMIVKLLLEHNLDIAIDLSGYTKHNKSHLFEYEISKVKINFLGYPGTMGTNKYDYILADPKIIPKEDFNFILKKLLICQKLINLTRQYHLI